MDLKLILVSLMAFLAWGTQLGVMMTQFGQVKANQDDSKIFQAAITLKMNEFREKQIVGLAKVDALEGNVRNLDNRVLVIERVFVERPELKTVKP
jgi:hypothetical protein